MRLIIAGTPLSLAGSVLGQHAKVDGGILIAEGVASEGDRCSDVDVWRSGSALQVLLYGGMEHGALKTHWLSSLLSNPQLLIKLLPVIELLPTIQFLPAIQLLAAIPPLPAFLPAIKLLPAIGPVPACHLAPIIQLLSII